MHSPRPPRPRTCWRAESQDRGRAAPSRHAGRGSPESCGSAGPRGGAAGPHESARLGWKSVKRHRPWHWRLQHVSPQQGAPGTRLPAHGSRVRTRAPRPTPLEAVPPEPWSAWDPVWAETAEGATSCPAAQPCRPVRRAGPRALVSDAGGGGPGRWSQGCAGCHSRPGPPPPPPPGPSPSWRSPFPCADTEPCPSPGSVLLQPPQGLPVGAGACPLHPRSHSGGPGRCPHGPGHCGPTATPCCL